MKIRMIRKATVFLMAVLMVLATATGAFALAYYEAGTPDNSSAATNPIRFGYIGLDKAIIFNYSLTTNLITGASNSEDTMIGTTVQKITGNYTLGSGSGGIYNLIPVSTNSTVAVTDGGATTYLTATAKALSINFNQTGPGANSITWEIPISMGTITAGTSTTLAEMGTIKTGGYFQFSEFTFEHSSFLDLWLTGGSALNARYYSKLEGFAAAPEPAEWMLMFIGLGMLGFYLQRRGYLNFDLSPQSVA